MNHLHNPTPINLSLTAQIQQLQAENQRLRQENQDLRIALATTAEHGDFVEAELYKANQKLASEIEVRAKAEATLQALFEVVSRQKNDLEIIVQTLIEHGDTLDIQWQQKFRDVTHQAGIDSLTQIPNRRQFSQYLQQQWQHLQEEQLPLGIILGDIDAFKCYNDTYGHLAGDACLQKVALAFSTSLQHSEDLAARYGGEEFVAILPRTDLSGAVRVAQRIQARVQRLQIPHDHSLTAAFVTISLGVASQIPQADRQPNHLLHQADARLYEAKRCGKNCIVSTDR